MFCRTCFFESNQSCTRGSKVSWRLKRWPTDVTTVGEPASPSKKRKSVALGEDTPQKKKPRKSNLPGAEDGDDSGEEQQRTPVSNKKSNKRFTTQSQLAHRERVCFLVFLTLG